VIELHENIQTRGVLEGEAYLRSGVKLEPLVDRWYAWPHQLAPAQQALNLAFRHLPTVRSFIAAPSVHAAAAADPTMYGGPFLDLPVDAVGAAETYLNTTLARRSKALAFATAFRAFDTVLQSANGFSLDELRLQAPEQLRGLIELAYDLNHHPKMRLLEEMFEEDDMGHAGAQEIFLHHQPDVERPFFLSTPRLGVGVDGMFVKGPFGSAVMNTLCASRQSAVNLKELAAEGGWDATALAGFFSEERPGFAERYSGTGVRIRYFGHACLLIETGRVAILIDPTVANEANGTLPHLKIEDLPRQIDILFISHGHQDHFHPELLMQLRQRVGMVIIPPHNHGEPADPSLIRMLRNLGYRAIKTLEPLESFDLLDGSITALPFSGEHCDLDVHSKHCALVELRGRRIGVFVDSDAIDIDVYRRLSPRLRDLDVLFVGMECFGAPLSWLYGPLVSTPIPKRVDSSRRLSGANCSRARALVDLLRPNQVFVYAMGQEPWMRYLMGMNYTDDSIQISESSEFLRWCRSEAISADRLYLHFEQEF